MDSVSEYLGYAEIISNAIARAVDWRENLSRAFTGKGLPQPPVFCRMTSCACGHGSAGRAQPCQGWGRGFESRCPLHENRNRSSVAPKDVSAGFLYCSAATSPSGKAEACKAFISGSNPLVASRYPFSPDSGYIQPIQPRFTAIAGRTFPECLCYLPFKHLRSSV